MQQVGMLCETLCGDDVDDDDDKRDNDDSKGGLPQAQILLNRRSYTKLTSERKLITGLRPKPLLQVGDSSCRQHGLQSWILLPPSIHVQQGASILTPNLSWLS